MIGFGLDRAVGSTRGGDQHAGIEDALRVERALGGGERGAEQGGALALIPGHVIAADGVVMQSGVAKDWEDARIAAIEHIYPPSEEARQE